MANTEPAARPRVTLAYAQSLDGSIAAQPGHPLALSGPESLRLTHTLRARHDAILAGIGTVLADDPQLTVRLVEGRNPRPVIVDSQLRCPPAARLFRSDRQPIIATTTLAPESRAEALQQAGARILRLPPTDDAQVSLPDLLAALRAEGIATLMVEGGARIITSFIKLRMVDEIVLTIAPLFVGGVRAVNELLSSYPAGLPRLRDMTWQQLGPDLIVQGALDWPTAP
ncbi:MAG: RibD family protein [Candidatus Roseilinea sp.]|uniref:RibD family protein n=1 Tax=Candidatus Roseilinea sp. TaxID=2838777 RepID=UPI0040491172